MSFFAKNLFIPIYFCNFAFDFLFANDQRESVVKEKAFIDMSIITPTSSPLWLKNNCRIGVAIGY